MNRQIIFGLICLAILCNTSKLFAQFIEKYTIEFDFEAYNQINNVEQQTNLDFLNAIDEFEDFYVDEANININTHFWIKNNWESNIEIGLQSDLVPRHFDLMATKTYNNWGFNLGFGNEIFFLYNVETYLETRDKQFDLEDIYVQFFYSLWGPYGGVNYQWKSKRLLVVGNINSGVQWNITKDKYIIMKEEKSNYIKHLAYDIKNTPSLWIAPSVKTYFSIINKESFAFGPLLKYRYYYTTRRLKYEQTAYEWTKDNPVVSEPKVALHHIQRHSFYFGIFFMFK